MNAINKTYFGTVLVNVSFDFKKFLLKIQVKDSGIGINETTRKKLKILFN
jgi:signal transduction histidine kinase